MFLLKNNGLPESFNFLRNMYFNQIQCQNGDKQKRRHAFNRNGDNGILKRRQSIQPKTATEGRSRYNGLQLVILDT